jgi:hypothetical protein
VDNSRSTAAARQGLARLRKILDQLAVEAAEAGNDMEGMEHGFFYGDLMGFHGDVIGFYGDFMGFYGDFNGI